MVNENGSQCGLLYLGVDPGATGALGALNQVGEVVGCYDCPPEPAQIGEIVRQVKQLGRIAIAVVEHVHSMPKQGVASSFKFGANFGAWRGALGALGVPVVLIAPRKWQLAVLDSEARRRPKGSLEFARRRWPDAQLNLAKHHGRADSLCLAEYGRLMGKVV